MKRLLGKTPRNVMGFLVIASLFLIFFSCVGLILYTMYYFVASL